MVAMKAVGGHSLDIFKRKEYGLTKKRLYQGRGQGEGQIQSWAPGWVWMLQTRTRCEDNRLFFGSEI